MAGAEQGDGSSQQLRCHRSSHTRKVKVHAWIVLGGLQSLTGYSKQPSFLTRPLTSDF